MKGNTLIRTLRKLTSFSKIHICNEALTTNHFLSDYRKYQNQRTKYKLDLSVALTSSNHIIDTPKSLKDIRLLQKI